MGRPSASSWSQALCPSYSHALTWRKSSSSSSGVAGGDCRSSTAFFPRRNRIAHTVGALNEESRTYFDGFAVYTHARAGRRHGGGRYVLPHRRRCDARARRRDRPNPRQFLFPQRGQVVPKQTTINRQGKRRRTDRGTQGKSTPRRPARPIERAIAPAARCPALQQVSAGARAIGYCRHYCLPSVVTAASNAAGGGHTRTGRTYIYITIHPSHVPGRPVTASKASKVPE